MVGQLFSQRRGRVMTMPVMLPLASRTITVPPVGIPVGGVKLEALVVVVPEPLVVVTVTLAELPPGPVDEVADTLVLEEPEEELLLTEPLVEAPVAVVVALTLVDSPSARADVRPSTRAKMATVPRTFFM
jgi:hypothetical protein